MTHPHTPDEWDDLTLIDPDEHWQHIIDHADNTRGDT